MDACLNSSLVNYSYIKQLHAPIQKSELPDKPITHLSEDVYLNAVKKWVYNEDGTPFYFKLYAESRIKNFLDDRLLFSLDLSGLRLHSIPPLYYLKNLEILLLYNNLLTKFDSSHFLQNSNLHFLDLSNNQLCSFGETSFISSSSLSILVLNSNFFRRLTHKCFSGLPNLQCLEIKNNVLAKIDSDTFFNHNKLNRLILKKNVLTCIPHTLMRDLSHVDVLDLSKNSITRFQCSFSTFSGSRIDLRENPIELWNLVELYNFEYLESYKGPIFDLSIMLNESGFMQHCSKKMKFDVEMIKNDTYFDYFVKLKEWVLQEDGTDFEIKKKVHSLILAYLNQHVVDRVDLDLSYMGLCTIPPLFALNHLKELHLNHNNLYFFDPNVLPFNSKITLLDLSNNFFSELDMDSFSRVPNLKSLKLDANKFTRLDAHYFSKVSLLNDLSLEDNMIEDIHLDVFLNLSLYSLILCNNRLISFPKEVVRHQSQLAVLDLSKNLLTRFDWLDENLASPDVDLSDNLFSLREVVRLNDLQNMDGYVGPRYELNLMPFDPVSIFEVSFDSFSSTLFLWNPDDSQEKWFSLFNVTDPFQISLYNNFNIFLRRLYNEVPRTPFGDLPPNVKFFVSEILSVIEQNILDLNFFSVLCNMASNALSNCVDRLGVCLILMFFCSKKYQAEKLRDSSTVLFFQHQINCIESIVQFVDSVHDFKIILDLDTGSFLDISSLDSEGVYVEDCEKKVSLNVVSKKTRENFIVSMNDKGRRLRVFNIGDQVEDVLLIINALSFENYLSVDPIDIRFGCVATLRDYLDEVLVFLKSKPVFSFC